MTPEQEIVLLKIRLDSAERSLQGMREGLDGYYSERENIDNQNHASFVAVKNLVFEILGGLGMTPEEINLVFQERRKKALSDFLLEAENVDPALAASFDQRATEDVFDDDEMQPLRLRRIQP